MRNWIPYLCLPLDGLRKVLTLESKEAVAMYREVFK